MTNGFDLAGCTLKNLDEAPALRLAFTEPVDVRQDFGKFIRVADQGPIQGGPGGQGGQGEAHEQSAKPPAERSGTGNGARLVQGQWVAGEDPRELFFQAIQPQRGYRIEIDPGLQSIDQAKLSAARSCALSSDNSPPAYYFASRGTVLPAGQNGGLPIVTVNVPEVDVQFLRVRPDALPRFLERLAGQRPQSQPNEDEDGGEAEAGEGEGEGEGYEGYYDGNPNRLKGATDGWQLDQWKGLTDSVHLARYQTEAQANQRRVSFLPVEHIAELQKPGVYIAVMSEPGRFAKAYQVSHFYVSDIGLQLQRQAQGLSVFATSLRSGKALSGVQVQLLDAHNRAKAQGQTDSQGHWRIDNPSSAAALVLARSGQQITPLRLRDAGLDLSEFDVGGHASRDIKLFAYAGRDLYRPGEAFELSVLARDADGRPTPPLPLQATLKRPDGRTVSQESWSPDPKRAGYLQRKLALPADAQTGRWSLELRHDPAAKQANTVWRFQVEEFLPERMKLELKTAKPILGPGDPFQVSVQGDYLYGAPAAGNRLIVLAASERQREALPKAWPGFYFGDVADDSRRSRQPVSDTQLNESGQAEVDLPLPGDGAHSPMKVTGSFSLLESGGRPVVRSIERTVWPAAQLIGLRPLFDREVAGEDSKAGFELIRVDPQGQVRPVAGVQLKLLREDRQYHWRFDDQRGWQNGFVETEELQLQQTLNLGGTRSRVDLPVRYGRYRLELRDPETGQVARYRFYAGWGAQDAEDVGNRPDRVKLAWRKAPFKEGQAASLSIQPPHDGEALVTVQSGARLLWSERISVSASGSEVDIPLGTGPDWARHDLYATVTAFRPGSQGERVTPARAVGLVHLPLARQERQLQVQLQAPAKTEPDRKVAVKLKVSGHAKGATTHVTLSAVDVGILNITRFASPDAFDFFFGKQRFAAEWLDMYGRLIEKMDGQLAKLRWGGDASARDTQSLPKKVLLVDLFSGPVALDAKGEATVMLSIPDFNGSLRLMAVAFNEAQYGKAQAEMVSAAPSWPSSTPRASSPPVTRRRLRWT